MFYQYICIQAFVFIQLLYLLFHLLRHLLLLRFQSLLSLQLNSCKVMLGLGFQNLLRLWNGWILQSKTFVSVNLCLKQMIRSLYIRLHYQAQVLYLKEGILFQLSILRWVFLLCCQVLFCFHFYVQILMGFYGELFDYFFLETIWVSFALHFILFHLFLPSIS